MAIAYDNSLAQFNGTGATTHTISYTMGSVSNGVLVVGARVYDSGTISGTPTYAGSNLTAINNQANGTDTQYLYYILNPTAGANNLVFNLSASKRLEIAVVSLSGVKQSAQPDASGSNTASSTDANVTITTVAGNSWGVMLASDNGAGGAFTDGTNGTVRASVSDRSGVYTTGPKTPAGSLTMHGTLGSSGTWFALAASFSPATATFNYATTGTFNAV